MSAVAERKARQQARADELERQQVAVLEHWKERAERLERGEDPGPWLRLVSGGLTQQ